MRAYFHCSGCAFAGIIIHHHHYAVRDSLRAFTAITACVFPPECNIRSLTIGFQFGVLKIRLGFKIYSSTISNHLVFYGLHLDFSPPASTPTNALAIASTVTRRNQVTPLHVFSREAGVDNGVLTSRRSLKL